MYTRKFIVVFALGIIVGIAGVLVLPDYVRPFLPESLLGDEAFIPGTVLAKQKEKNALLVTVNTQQGALLATFTKKVAEVDLLVNEKDQIELLVKKYLPFIEDPKIQRVVKSVAPSGPALGVKPPAAAPKAGGKPTPDVNEKATPRTGPAGQPAKPDQLVKPTPVPPGAEKKNNIN